MKIPQTNPGISFKLLQPAIQDAMHRVLSSGWYILGNEVKAFEQAFSSYIGCRYALGVASGTDALELILRGLYIGAGDLVATVGNTAVATVSSIDRVGAKVRFIDVNPADFTMSPDSLEECLEKEPRIKAIIAVHLFGHPANMGRLLEIAKRHGIPLVEDCAQAHAAIYGGEMCGSVGVAGAFSFYPTKNLGAMGDAGTVVTNDQVLYERILALRQYGWQQQRYVSDFSGINSRLDEIQAAILSVKLPYLYENNQKRRKLAACYHAALAQLPEIVVPQEQPECKSVFHQYVIRVKNARRSALMEFLANNGIGSAIHYPVCIPRQPAYAGVSKIVSLENTFVLNEEILSLPMYPELSQAEIDYVIQKILDFFR